MRCVLLVMLALLGLATRSAETADDSYRKAATKDWPMVGGDWNNSRYSALAQINRHSVNKLGTAWRSQKFESGATSRATPVVKNGLMFITAGRHVYALSARTGERVWIYDTAPDVPPSTASSAQDKLLELVNSRRGIPNGKGVGVGANLVFVGLKDGRVIALQQQTGKFVWSQQTGIDEPKKGQWAAVAPTYSNGRIFTGLSDGDHNHRGRLAALDATTGARIWQMFAIPDPGERGHDTWPSFNETWKFGGGGVWTNPPVDPELGIVYFTAGNAVPAYGGDWRPGDNLYTCSVLAVDIRTGKLRWHYQLVHHDVYEADLGIPIVLYEARVDGRRRKALAVMRADGHMFTLDRETGEPLLAVEERPVPQLESQRTSLTQPFPVNGESILMSCDEWRKEQLPAGFVLGCMWTPPASPPPSTDPQNVLTPFPAAKGGLLAYSPDTQYFYAHSRSFLYWARRSQDPYFLTWVGAVPGLKAYSRFVAIDSRTGKIAWRKAVPDTRAAGAPLATAGGLVFRSSGTGAVEAYDAKTGDVAWQFHSGTAGESSPAASYEIAGQQYIAVSLGPEVWAFRLGGRPDPSAALAVVAATQEELAGPLVLATPVVATDEIEMATMHRSLVEPGARYFFDEFTFNPYVAQVKTGTKVAFVNNGLMRHEVIAVDGSWGSGPLSPAQEAWLTFDKPGEYAYMCKDHPWSHGRLEVVAVSQSAPRDDERTTTNASDHPSVSIDQQARRGKERFDTHCSACHGIDLGGRATAPALSGQPFLLRWANATVAELLDNIRTTMPQADPGSLDRQTYLDVVAYLLQANRLATGPSELKDDAAALRSISIRAER